MLWQWRPVLRKSTFVSESNPFPFSSHTTFCAFRNFYREAKIHAVVAAAAAVVKRTAVDQAVIPT